jgi:hypothetical protein
LEGEYRIANEKYRELELYGRERAHAITQKNLKISQLEDLVESTAARRDRAME